MKVTAAVPSRRKMIGVLVLVSVATAMLLMFAWPPPPVDTVDLDSITPTPFPVGGLPTTALPNRRGVRVAIPLLLTHVRYHGTSLLATTLKGWILKLLIPQGNIDLLIFYDPAHAPLDDIVRLLKLERTDQRPPHVSESEHEASKPVDYFIAPHISRQYVLQLFAVDLVLPKYAQADATVVSRIYNDSTWMKCGCPPYCPPKRATVHYVQGTRWYTAQMFQERRGLIARQYQYWIKLDVDIWVFRPPPFNLGDEMAKKGAVVAHTGYAYNGHGCSNELSDAIRGYCKAHAASAAPCPMASGGDPFWKQDDTVYYSNFIMSSVAFHTRGLHLGDGGAGGDGASPFGLADHLNEYPTGFFKYRWTDQSLFHKVIGVFAGPNETAYALDWSGLRCDKKAFHRGAIFWHSKKHKTSAELRRCTDL